MVVVVVRGFVCNLLLMIKQREVSPIRGLLLLFIIDSICDGELVVDKSWGRRRTVVSMELGGKKGSH